MIVDTLTKASGAIPTPKFRPNLKPFLNSELSALKKKKITKFKTWVRDGRPREQSSKVWKEQKDRSKEILRKGNTES